MRQRNSKHVTCTDMFAKDALSHWLKVNMQQKLGFADVWCIDGVRCSVWVEGLVDQTLEAEWRICIGSWTFSLCWSEFRVFLRSLYVCKLLTSEIWANPEGQNFLWFYLWFMNFQCSNFLAIHVKSRFFLEPPGPWSCDGGLLMLKIVPLWI